MGLHNNKKYSKETSMKIMAVMFLCVLSIKSHASCFSDLENGNNELSIGNHYYNKSIEMQDEVYTTMKDLLLEPSFSQCQKAVTYLELTWKSSYHYYISSLFGERMSSSSCSYKNANNQSISLDIIDHSSEKYQKMIGTYVNFSADVKNQCVSIIDIPDLGMPYDYYEKTK